MKEEQATKTPEKWEAYYNETIFEDQEEIELIANTCNAILEERFSIVLKDPRLTTAMFLKTFESFVKKLKSFEKDYDFSAVVLDDSLIPHADTLSLPDRLESAIYQSLDLYGICAKYVSGIKTL